MNAKMWVGLFLVASSYAQLLVPRSVFAHPLPLSGYPIVPGDILAAATALFTLGVIVFGEGVCQRFASPSLWRLLTRDGWSLARVGVGAATAGLAMEFFARWLGKLWIYPYWTLWFYWLVLVPGYVFYWAAIVESYLALKAAVDAMTKPANHRASRHLAPRGRHLLGVIGAVVLLVTAWLYASWYEAHGGYVFTPTVPVREAPPFSYILLAFVGMWLTVEWGLRQRNTPSLAGSMRQAYRTPAVAVLGSSLLLSLAMEAQNAGRRYWTYTHFPGSDVTLFGTALSVFATWPLQYVVFLSIPGLFAPALAALFWQPKASAVSKRSI